MYQLQSGLTTKATKYKGAFKHSVLLFMLWKLVLYVHAVYIYIIYMGYTNLYTQHGTFKHTPEINSVTNSETSLILIMVQPLL